MPAPQPAAVPTSLVHRVLDPSAPKPLRLAAARGALPLSRPELVLVLVRLSSDADAEIATESSNTLSSTPADVLLALLRDPRTDAAVLEHFARRSETPPDLLAAIVVNDSTSDEVLLQLAASGSGEVLERIVVNESRLLRTPALAEALKSNPALSGDARRRISELEEHLLRRSEAPVAPVPTRVAEPEMPLPMPEVELVEGEAAAPLLEIPLTPEEQAAEDALRNTPLFQRIVSLKVAERVQVAIKGNAEERAILIRDPSRMVATTVLKSPKLSEQEVESFAKLRNVSDEVLRIIGNHRDWTKSYAIAHALARNPRTPTGISLTMLNRLNNRDLKNLGSDKNIPDVIRRSAKRLYDLHTKPPEKGKRK